MKWLKSTVCFVPGVRRNCFSEMAVIDVGSFGSLPVIAIGGSSLHVSSVVECCWSSAMGECCWSSAAGLACVSFTPAKVSAHPNVDSAGDTTDQRMARRCGCMAHLRELQ